MDWSRALSLFLSSLIIYFTLTNSQRARKPSDITRLKILMLQEEEADDRSSPALSIGRIYRANKIDYLRRLERKQNASEQLIELKKNSSGITVCVPLWQVQQMKQELIVRKLELLLQKKRFKKMRLRPFRGNAANNPTAVNNPNGANTNPAVGNNLNAANNANAVNNPNAANNPNGANNANNPTAANNQNAANNPTGAVNNPNGANTNPAVGNNLNAANNANAVNNPTAANNQNAANNPTAAAADSADSDSAEQDDDQTEEDDSESPTDDSNQSSGDDSANDPDNS